ncbi:hypothetical protein RB653_000626 [Dictyostelium firmibasis]|uniref:Uncharacterized protein n=1 Tax=Dictyostelium firmibasis TaxID=79012 RepID=A0AAN7TVI5_9MYCE
MFKLNNNNINNFKVLALLFSMIISSFVSNAQVYYPGFVNNMSTIPTIASSYFPVLVHNPPSTNYTSNTYKQAIDLLSPITDPIFNASEIQSLLTTWTTNIKTVIGNSIPSYVTQLNRIYRIDLLSEQMYSETNSAFYLTSATYAPLKAQGSAILNKVNAIKASFNGVSLTTTQQAQLSQFDALITKIQQAVSNCQLINISANDFIPFNSDSMSYMQYIADEIFTYDEVIGTIKQNNIRILDYIYDLYSTYNSLNQNF